MVEGAGMHTLNFDIIGKRSVRKLFGLYGILMIFMLAGCGTEEKSDAYGQFEATEIIISSEAQGRLLQFNVNEGSMLEAGQQVGYVDTSRLILQRNEIEAQLESIEAKIVNIDAEVEVQKEELSLAESNLKRTRALFDDHAATRQKLDDAQSRERTIRKRIAALQTQKQAIQAEINGTKARIEQIEDQIDDARVVNPVRGTVLTTFAEPYEIVQPGQPLYEIANLDTLELRVYISGAQLPSLTIGQQVEVLVDKNREENQRMDGSVSWIASEAEFTPKMIQTKEERVTQVYAVKVRVPNADGTLKIGMPGEINFIAGSVSQQAGGNRQN